MGALELEDGMQRVAMLLFFVSLTACQFLTDASTTREEDGETAGSEELPSYLSGQIRPLAQPASELPADVGGGRLVLEGGVYMAGGNIEPPQDSGSRIILAIANDDFDFREYAAIRKTLERDGHEVVVTADRKVISKPEASTAPPASGMVMPDLAWSDVDAGRYDALILVGGRGAYRHLYAFSGTIDDAAFKFQKEAAQRLNQLIAAFITQDKVVAAIGTAMAILAWARIDGATPIAARQVAGAESRMPACTLAGRMYRDGQLSLIYQLELNGAIVADPGVIGNPSTSADDVVFDGRFVTGAGAEAAAEFAQALGGFLDDRREVHAALGL